MQDELRTNLASPLDRDKLVAEIFCGPNQVAEINREGEELQIEIYGHPEGITLKVSYEEFMRVLRDAERRLRSRTQAAND